MAKEARARTPKRVDAQRDVRGAPLSPTDGFVLSRIDGSLSERDLANLTGLGKVELSGSLSKLQSLGLITYEEPRTVSGISPAPPPAEALQQPMFRTPEVQEPGHLAELSADDAAALCEDVELDVELRKQVLAMRQSVEHLDHYALLGIGRDADKKAVKRAYYELATKFHPDRHFRKKLGSYKSRLEVVFSRITTAHDTLSNKERRAEYDAYLDEQLRVRGFERTIAEAAEETRRAEENIERRLRADETTKTTEPPASSAEVTTARPGAISAPPQIGSLPPAVDPATRRDAFARRLLGGRPAGVSSTPPSRSSSVAPPRSMSSDEAIAALKVRYEDRVGRAKALEAGKYIQRGEQALAGDQIVSAANAFRVAAGLVPADAQLAERARELQARADVLLGDTYLRQAQYEEKGGHLREAARSWVRACKVRPKDAHTHEHAALALLRSNGDLHEAARVAWIACELEPTSAPKRVTLVNVYLAAGLLQNARRELQTASRLDPDDSTIQAMLKRLNDGT